MKNPHNRHEVTDNHWKKLEPILNELMKGSGGSNAKDMRVFINAVCWILRTGSPWRDLPSNYGKFGSVHQRFKRWCDEGKWDVVLEALIDNPDFEWLMIDGSHCKVHPHAAGAVGGNQTMGSHKRGLNTKIHMAVDAHGMPVKVIITSGVEADCKQALHLIKDIDAQALFADKAYDTNEILEYAQSSDMEAIIPPKKNRVNQREFDKALYKHRHLVENSFLKIKNWRGIATRYAKTTSAFHGAVYIACAFQWLKILA